MQVVMGGSYVPTKGHRSTRERSRSSEMEAVRRWD